MTRRLLLLVSTAVLFAAACAELPEPEVSFGDGPAFVPMVADALDDVGLGNDLEVDADGQPFMSYFGFPSEEGDVAATRPINTAFLPAVQLTTVTDGIFVRGAVAQAQDVPAPQYVVPFGPDTVETLENLGPDDSDRTALAIAGDGTKHVAWTSNDGIWYASGAESFSAEQVEVSEDELGQAVSFGPPSIVTDEAGNPWIAYQALTADGVEVRVASPGEDASGEGIWNVEVAATAARCGDCPPPGAAPIGVLGDAPVVAFADQGAGDVKQATLNGARWEVTTGIPGVEATGLSMASTGDEAYLSYYADGAVNVATSSGSSWTPSEVAEADLGDAADETGNLAPTTDLALDDEGTVYVAWQDIEGVHMANGDGSTFEPVETRDTEGGVTPSVGASPDGATLYLSWFDPEAGDLLLGMYGETSDLVLAVPSPIPPPSAGAAPVGDCGEDGEPILEISSSGTTWTSNCLVAPAEEPFTITYDNPEAIQHNLAVYTEQGETDRLAGFDPRTGPFVEDIPVDALEAADYFFQCDIHPTTMIGTLAVVEPKGGGGGGNADGGGGGGNDAGVTPGAGA